MAGAAIVASFLRRQGLIRSSRIALGVAHRVGGLVAVDVAVDAPAHVERGELVDALHALHLAVAALTRHAGVHVTHVREVHVLRKLVDADPRNGFLGLAARIRVVVEELLDFGALPRGDAVDLRTVRTDFDLVVASEARADGGESGVRRLVRRVMTIQTVHPELLDLRRVRKVDRLFGGEILRGGGAAVRREEGDSASPVSYTHL